MKKLFIILVLILISNISFSEQTITNFTTNSPVPLDTKLVATGVYFNSDSNSSVYCKFLTYDLNTGKVIERFSDELNFSDGSFYTDRLMTEPKYYRDENVVTPDYKITVICGGASADANFSISQRESWDNQFFGELFYLKDNGPMLLFGGMITIIAIILLGALAFWIVKATQGKS